MRASRPISVGCVILGCLAGCDDPGVIAFGGAGGTSGTTTATSVTSSTDAASTTSADASSSAATTGASASASGSASASSSSGGCVPVDDGLACTIDACVNGQPTHEPDDTACPAGSSCDPADPGAGPTGCVAFDTCPPVLTVMDGVGVQGTTAGAANDFSLSCTNGAGMHPDIAYTLTLAADSDVLLEVAHDTNYQIAVAILPIDANTCGAELLCDAPAVAAAEIDVINLAAGTYAIVIDGNGPTMQSGAFTLTVLTQASSIGPGDLVINEIMADGGPGAALNSSGEWVEIANPGTIAIATAGLTLGDGTATTSPVKPSVGAQLIVQPGGYILGMNTLTAAMNGGIANGDFKISFAVNNTAGDVFRLAKGASNVIDLVDTTSQNPNGAFPNIGADGVTLQLDPSKKTAALNDNRTNWCNTPSATFGSSGAKGTPRASNQSCSAAACTAATQAVDCNDGNPLTQDVCVAGFCANL